MDGQFHRENCGPPKERVPATPINSCASIGDECRRASLCGLEKAARLLDRPL